MNHDPDRRPDADPDDVLSPMDAYFDGEMDQACQREFFDGLRRDPAAARAFAETAWIVERLRSGVQGASAPDLTASILRETDRRRAWLSPQGRRWARASRLATAAALLLALTAALVARREAPEVFPVASPEGPLTDVARSGAEAVGSVAGITGSVQAARAAMERVAGASREHMATAAALRFPASGPAVARPSSAYEGRPPVLDLSGMERRSVRCLWVKPSGSASDPDPIISTLVLRGG